MDEGDPKWYDEVNNEWLIECVNKGDLEGVRTAVSCGADANARDEKGVPAITLAAEKGHDRIVLVLIDADVDVNAQDRNGRTAIMAARNAEHWAIAGFLLEAGARE
ncbi:ankyrin repeat domain-containing protein [Dyella caseinilytica]|uniref:Ankyrin repeat domain-containing protein n=1 Tax=Dyella caseinilytica TaxID=1849581 RepID=A0ABX7GWV5_9GAMM|nr:ankyrin repeat domain-containing protein [Dyella caseinilytica]QRN54982.1 ankyrin repeat domain-containing protein [Dyella caseinilytica]GFZ98441.1 hypothetical protein GCM10011408_18800 [Dyella caseinilytica]